MNENEINNLGCFVIVITWWLIVITVTLLYLAERLNVNLFVEAWQCIVG